MNRNACDVWSLDSWTTTRRTCFQGIVLTRNLEAEPHKDRSGDRDGWVVMCCWGNFTGGDLVIPALQKRFEFKPGDVVILRSTLLEHYIMPCEGQRSSIMFFGNRCAMGNFEPEV